MKGSNKVIGLILSSVLVASFIRYSRTITGNEEWDNGLKALSLYH